MVVANPIYDIVFKYLMEDERIARTILSALLKKEVVAVEMRPHEYSNDERDSLSVFRIDFGATIRKSDGEEQLILVELQKTWLETETLRFRQYLGVQYRSPKNMKGDNALPMVAVYLLGHKVGDIEEPVLYVSHQAYDYNEKPVVKGLPHPFIESLTHDSIIVQIPRLHGQINNKLDLVLSIFDQTYTDQDDKQLLHLDEQVYSDDHDMQLILHQLTKAAGDVEMRHRMDVEDEYFSVIEMRDTEIMMKDKELAEKTVLLTEKDGQLAEKTVLLAEKDGQLAEKTVLLAEKDGQLAEKTVLLAEKDEKLAEKDEKLAEKDEKLKRQRAMLHSSVQMFLKAGMSKEEIATNLGLNIEELESL